MAGRPQSRGPWFVSAVVAAAAVGLVLVLFRPPRPVPPAPKRAAVPGLEVRPARGEGTNPALADEAKVHDPTPLFLPTEWNSAPRKPSSPADEGPFAPFGPSLAFDNKSLDLDLPPSHRMPAQPADALVENPPTQPFLGFGRGDTRLPPLAPRWGYVEIVAVGSGRRVFTQALTAAPPGLPPGGTDTPPVGGAWEYTAEVDEAGLVGTLVAKVQSGTEADGFFLNYLAKTLRVGQRLSPGIYRISLGP